MEDTAANSTESIAAAKTALRIHIRARRASLSGGEDRAKRDSALLTHLLQELDRRDPERSAGVAAYCPLPGEPGGRDLPDRITDTGRPLWVPVVDSPHAPLRWLRWRGASHARTATFGILEPVPGATEVPLDTPTLLDQIQNLVIPALAISPVGHRLGQGGGFYDRSLAGFTSEPAKRGRLLAIVDHEEFGIPVPTTELDITVPVVVTDTGVFHTRAQDRS
jgi:5-formyltetrahydrofolate cyclo-ligase